MNATQMESPVMTQNPEKYLPIKHADFHILVALADGQRHGYEIMLEVEARTEGRIRLAATSLYRSLKRMLDEGMVEESEERPDPEMDDERRRYYRLTEFGKAVVTLEARRLEELLSSRQVRNLLGPQQGTV